MLGSAQQVMVPNRGHQLGRNWTAIEYVSQYGMQAYLDAEQAKSSAMWSGLYDSAKDIWATSASPSRTTC